MSEKQEAPANSEGSKVEAAAKGSKAPELKAEDSSLSSKAFFDSMLDGERDTSIEITGKGPSFDDFEEVEKVRKETIKAKLEKVEDEKEGEAAHEPLEVVAKEEKPEEDLAEDPEVEKEVVKKLDKKTIKAMVDDQQQEIPVDAMIPVKIDGKIENVPMQEIINNYSGKQQFDRKFSELDRDRKKFVGERDVLLNHFKEMQTSISSGKPADALMYLVDLVGGDRHTFIKELRDGFAPEVLKLYSMSEEERELYETKLEEQALRAKLGKIQQSQESQKQMENLQRQLASLKEQHGVSDEDYELAAMELEGQIDPQEMSPQMVVNYVSAQRAINRVKSVVERISPKLTENSELIKDVADYVFKNKDVEDEFIDDLVRELTGINKNIAAISEKAKLQTKTAKISHEKKQAPMSWDDFEQ